jgi:hypothetical protein
MAPNFPLKKHVHKSMRIKENEGKTTRMCVFEQCGY